MTNILFWSVPGLFFLAAFMAAYVAVTKGRGFYGEYEAVFMDTATVNMEDMFLFVDPRRLFMFNLMAIVIIPALVWIISGIFFLALAVMVIVAVLPFQVYGSMRRRRYKAFEKILPDALTMISGSLLDTSMRNMERRLPIQDFQMLAAALRISREVGGNLAETLDKLADTLRRKATMEGKIDALTGQGVMQGYVMSALPLLLGTMLYFLEPKAMGMLFTTPKGWAVLTIVFVMEVLGFFFIRKVTTIDV